MDLRKKGFQLPDKIRFDEETLSATYGKLIAEPLERGFGTTVGNALRRIMLSSLEGAAVTGVKIAGVVDEFSGLDGMKEDVIDVILNVKKLRFRLHGASGETVARVKVTGPAQVTGADIEEQADLEILSQDLPIATLDKGVEFDMELHLRRGKGYVPAELNKEADASVDVIAVDAIFSPIHKVNFWVENARVGRSTDYDRLILEIWTDASITPQQALSRSAEIMVEHADLFILEHEEEFDDVEETEDVDMETPVFNEHLLKSVDELELSVRAHNCLKNADIRTIADLVQRTEHDMLRTKNFGRKSLNEIKEILHSMGLRFGMRVDTKALKKMQEESDAA